jgi:hypothetical protein
MTSEIKHGIVEPPQEGVRRSVVIDTLVTWLKKMGETGENRFCLKPAPQPSDKTTPDPNCGPSDDEILCEAGRTRTNFLGS